MRTRLYSVTVLEVVIEQPFRSKEINVKSRAISLMPCIYCAVLSPTPAPKAMVWPGSAGLVAFAVFVSQSLKVWVPDER
jgi:hypothetical protein